MPKVSREQIANVDDHGLVEDRHEDVEGTTIQFVTIREDVDATPLLRGLPNDSCTCPHWGYVFKGKVKFTYADGHSETYEAGDAYYAPPGHTPTLFDGTELVEFHPSEELAKTMEVVTKNVEAAG